MIRAPGAALHQPPRPSDARRLHHVFEAACDRAPSAVALECGGQRLTYRELDERANRLAQLLRESGIGGGARVAILLERSVETYVALLGIGKAGAAFVPIDPESPPDRIAYIAGDAGIDLLLTSSQLADAAAGLDRPVLLIDECAAALAAASAIRLELARIAGQDKDPTAYVIYTSGSSGRPKGVEVAQSSICNFLDVVAEVYDVRPNDRVYQGMTIAFDFSIEEIWPTWSVGATLVAGPTDSGRFGAELADFLDEMGITVLYCVPTLLATIPRDLPRIRNLLVGGEACPGQLVERWSRPGRRILNTYGPTEGTVTATWCELRPGRPVTIGRPLPTYSIVLLDEQRRVVPDGEVGEICIGGPGVARGYVGRPELTADRFIEHALAPCGGRLYRTGDLGRLTADGEIEYLGRADAEVKIRGHRVDLGEIENVLLEDADVSEAVAALVPVSDAPDAPRELAAYIVRSDHDSVGEDALIQRLYEQLQSGLPGYMVPSFLDVVAALPTMPSGKVDRNRLPAPTSRRLALAGGPVVAAEGEMEEQIRAAWAEAFSVEPESLSVEANFFTDLGGHSLLAARVVSLLRARKVGASPAVRDLYEHPTVRGMAAHLDGSTRSNGPVAPPRPAPLRHRSRRLAAAGAGQAVVIYLLLLLLTLPVSYVYTWNNGAVSVDVLVQLMIAILLSYLGVRWVVPVLLARPLVAGIQPGRYRLWGLTYIRLWALNLLLALGPLPVLSGSPLMATYLRLLGARIGRRTTIATSMISLPTLIDIGADASVGYGASLRPWRVADGWVDVAPITVGSGAFVGANAVLEPGASVGVGAGLGEQSVLGQGESVPPGARWSGSPPSPSKRSATTVETMLRADPVRDWRLRHVFAAVLGLVGLEIGAIAMIVPSVALVWWALLKYGVLAGLVATIPAGPLYVLTVCTVVAIGKRTVLPRVPVGIHLVRSGLGVRKWIADKLLEFSLMFTNSLYATLYTVPWLRLLGARVGRGAEVSTAAYLDPDRLILGPESFVADMASVGAATYANGRVAFLPTEVGSRAFIGNAAFVPAGTKLGDGSLVGVGTVPPDDHVLEGTSWLGSPAMHLPLRQSSGSFSEAQTFRPPRRVIAHRLAIEFFRATLPASILGASFYLYLLALSALANGRDLLVPALVSPLVVVALSVMVIKLCAAIKQNLVGTYRPRMEPLWSSFVRRTEFVTGLYEAAAVPAGVGLLVGTPFLPPVLRWFGVSIGRRTWIGTTYLTEFDLVQIGDDATVGTEVSLQTHLFEDRVMKMSVVTIGDGATIGSRAIVLYDAVVGNDVWLGSLSLLMKGEHLIAGSRWRGIPAQGMAA
ncbi:MAG TPA: Pls/PosA family non-ribosomal peptide synthetase [Micromonospora sp.]|nr:Pls/PosA family non-ribosomal peptide synthetase [Micromonospora sp.]